MITLKVVTPDGTIYDDATITKVTLPTTTGEITVLPGHIPLLSILAPGEILIYKDDGPATSLATSGGMLEVRKGNLLYLLADTAERAEHIDLDRAEAARRRAEELIRSQKEMGDVEFARLQASMEKELARLRVGKKYRKLPPAS